MNYTKPNFTKSILNISASLAKYLQVQTDKPSLANLDQVLSSSSAKNVVFICFDGMGIHPLQVNLSNNSFLRSHVIDELTSTFPSTTTCATTTLATCTYPLEHGWLGWTLHFDEIDANVDVYVGKEHQTGKDVNCVYPLEFNGAYYFDRCRIDDVTLHTVFPHYVLPSKLAQNHVTSNLQEFCLAINQACAQSGKQFVYAYFPEPDYTMHEHGVTSQQAKTVIESINKAVVDLANCCPNTLFVITADHGQIDVAGQVDFYLDAELMAMLKCPPYLDARTPCFRVKQNCLQDFERLFTERYGSDFELHKTEELISQGYFGSKGNKAHLLGDFIAIGTFTHKIFNGYPPCDDDIVFKGHHTSTTEEMLVPLIVIQN